METQFINVSIRHVKHFILVPTCKASDIPSTEYRYCLSACACNCISGICGSVSLALDSTAGPDPAKLILHVLSVNEASQRGKLQLSSGDDSLATTQLTRVRIPAPSQNQHVVSY
ncbi:hypothetical protein ACLOJK_013723 [Asimina triloba]